MEKTHFENYEWGYEAFKWEKTGYPCQIEAWVHDYTVVDNEWICLLEIYKQEDGSDGYEFHEVLDGRQKEFMLISDNEFEELGGVIHDGADGTTMYLIPDKYLPSIFNTIMEKICD